MDNIQRKKRLRNLIWIFLAVGAAAAVLAILAYHGLRIPCVFYELTGLQCPGCGNTRAVVATMRLDFKAAFSYNPLYLLEIGYIGWVFIMSAVNYVKKGRFSYPSTWLVLDAVVLIVVMLWGVVRNFL